MTTAIQPARGGRFVIAAPIALMIGLAMPALHSANAADLSKWSRVRHLQAGTRIAIDLADQRRVEGRFARASDSDVTYTALREITISRNDVVRVSRKPRLNRAVRMLIGAAIGLGAGAIVNGTLGAELHNEGRDISAATLGGGAAIGAILGAVSSRRGYTTIYWIPKHGNGASGI